MSFQIVDIPTTLLTSSAVIAWIDSYWGAGDREFKEALARREIAAFGRRVRGLIQEKQLRSGMVSVIALVVIRTAKSEIEKSAV